MRVATVLAPLSLMAAVAVARQLRPVLEPTLSTARRAPEPAMAEMVVFLDRLRYFQPLVVHLAEAVAVAVLVLVTLALRVLPGW
jgi:hypothetical protein